MKFINYIEDGSKFSMACDFFFKKIKLVSTGIKKLFLDALDVNYNLGLFYLRENKMSDAELRFKILLFFKPDYYYAKYQLARCLYARGRVAEAEAKLMQVLQIQPDFVEAQYMLSIVNNNSEYDLIPESVIEEYYDGIAESYDTIFSIATCYRDPEYLVDIAANFIKPKESGYNLLDIGCGTGKSSMCFAREFKLNSVTGIDISKNMLERTSSVISKAIHSDYKKYASETEEKYDLVIAGQSLHFCKNLSPVLENISKLLHPNSVFVFSVEAHDENIEVLLNTQFTNFAYNERYLKEQVRNSGLTIEAIKRYMSNSKDYLILVCKI